MQQPTTAYPCPLVKSTGEQCFPNQGFAAALDALRSATDPQPTDRVVPLSPRQVCRRVQALATRAGLDGVSAHSGRRGMATELVRRGARYASAVSVEDGAVARYFGG